MFSFLTLAVKEVENHKNKLKNKAKSTTFKNNKYRVVLLFLSHALIIGSYWYDINDKIHNYF